MSKIKKHINHYVGRLFLNILYMDDYEYFFALRSSEVDSWEIGIHPMIISQKKYLIGQYMEYDWFNKPVFDTPNSSYECIILKINKNTNRKNEIVRQLKYQGVHHSDISEVYLYGFISSSTIMNAKEKIKNTIIDTQKDYVSVPVYADITAKNIGDEFIITLQGHSNHKYITYYLTLPLFKVNYILDT